ncbi:octopamine receptor beta-2R-like [Palaemon carinicauda]|uniref:octopamine receptor beta-2R-like n=1 Tax=Palaemon carinicauda TaxID=392227 RepID=UPI0035B57991
MVSIFSQGGGNVTKEDDVVGAGGGGGGGGAGAGDGTDDEGTARGSLEQDLDAADLTAIAGRDLNIQAALMGIKEIIYTSLVPPDATDSFAYANDTFGTKLVAADGGVGASAPSEGAGGGAEDWVTGVNLDMGPTWVAILVLVLKGLVMFAVIVASVLGNLLVIVSVARYHKLRVITNYFVVSMALADMLVALMAMVFNASVQLTNTWLFGPLMCDLWNSMDVYFSTVSILHLCCISIDRYTAIVQPLDYPLRMTVSTVTLMLAIAWISPVFISVLPIFLGWYTTQKQLDLMASTPGLCEFKVNLAYALVSSSMSFWIPGIIMLVMYFRIYREADRQEMMVFRSTVAALLLNKHLHINGMTRGSVKITDDAPSNASRGGGVVGGSVKDATTNGTATGFDNLNITETCLDQPPSEGVAGVGVGGGSGRANDIPNSDESTPTPSPGSTPIGKHGKSAMGVKRRFLGVGVRKSSAGVGPDAMMGVSEAGEAKKKQSSLHKMKRERKAAKTLGIIVSVFLLCWLPFFTWYLVSALCGDACAVPDTLVTILFWIGYFNSTLNPVIYAYFNRDFRKAFRKTLKHYGLDCARCRKCSRGCCGHGRRLVRCVGGGQDTPSSEVQPRSALSSEYCHIEMTTVDKVTRMGTDR